MIDARINTTDGMQLINEEEGGGAVISGGFVSEMENTFDIASIMNLRKNRKEM